MHNKFKYGSEDGLCGSPKDHIKTNYLLNLNKFSTTSLVFDLKVFLDEAQTLAPRVTTPLAIGKTPIGPNYFKFTSNFMILNEI